MHQCFVLRPHVSQNCDVLSLFTNSETTPGSEFWRREWLPDRWIIQHRSDLNPKQNSWGVRWDVTPRSAVLFCFQPKWQQSSITKSSGFFHWVLTRHVFGNVTITLCHTQDCFTDSGRLTTKESTFTSHQPVSRFWEILESRMCDPRIQTEGVTWTSGWKILFFWTGDIVFSEHSCHKRRLSGLCTETLCQNILTTCVARHFIKSVETLTECLLAKVTFRSVTLTHKGELTAMGRFFVPCVQNHLRWKFWNRFLAFFNVCIRQQSVPQKQLSPSVFQTGNCCRFEIVVKNHENFPLKIHWHNYIFSSRCMAFWQILFMIADKRAPSVVEMLVSLKIFFMLSWCP